ncbi:MAG: hypothetical protein KGO96_13695 [Elusimicrobia bacterium]|nr:hypothetical protein [Elusimicrobiota bacterium]MDE2236258.1 hypothetical protein [Elusimicrobiota bacterium]MDE2426948.1 hypothetical protein [Elusimicrobiota bacterium]
MAAAEVQARWRAAHPWMVSHCAARQRCQDSRHISFPYYGGAGIAFELSPDETRALWERDGASKMRRPSLDRIDSQGNYEFSNCRFIELSANVSAPKHFYRLGGCA